MSDASSAVSPQATSLDQNSLTPPHQITDDGSSPSELKADMESLAVEPLSTENNSKLPMIGNARADIHKHDFSLLSVMISGTMTGGVPLYRSGKDGAALARMVCWANDDTYTFHWDNRTDIPDHVLDDYADIHGEDDLLISIKERSEERKMLEGGDADGFDDFIWSSDDEEPAAAEVNR